MNLTSNFKKFLTDTVNLNKTRFDTASSGIDTVTSFLKSDPVLKELFVDASPQGSFRQKTIIKPASEDLEFDVDLLFEMKIVNDWEPTDYLKNVAARFNLSERYKNKVDTKGKSRCVTLDYESDFHIDVVPAVRSGNALFVMNKNTNEYEPTDGDGYAEWFGNKNVLAGGFLVEAVRLIKYVRDTRQTFTVRSILLTTLLGNQVIEGDDTNLYSNLPTTLKTLVNRLDAYLQMNSSMPEIINPILPTESFNRHWDQEKYDNFREKINSLNQKINGAYDEVDDIKSHKKWQVVFGDEFPSLGESGKTPNLQSFPLGSINHAKPLEWPSNLQAGISIDAYVYIKTGGEWKLLGGLNSDGRQLQNGVYLKYKAKTNATQPYIVKWQVVNTGPHAASENALRGTFFDGKLSNNKPSSDPLVNWESTLYTGKHWIECFVIKGETCIGRSGKFFVNIKNPAY